MLKCYFNLKNIKMMDLKKKLCIKKLHKKLKTLCQNKYYLDSSMHKLDFPTIIVV